MDVELHQVEARSLENPSSSSDIKDGSIATCRICLEWRVDEDDQLISPCMCKGTQQFVHRSCLDCWRSFKEGFDFSHCSTCKAQFHLRVFNKTSWSTTKFKLLVARDGFLVFLYIQTVIGILGLIAYRADIHWSFSNRFDDSWFRIFSRHSIPLYYSVGLLLFILSCYYGNKDQLMEIYEKRWCCDWLPKSVNVGFGLLSVIVLVLTRVGINGYHNAAEPIQAIWGRHYHILTRKHTQTYVVKDLKGCYTPAKLDPDQMKRLKRLKLL